MKTSDFDFTLPDELIAQLPPETRGTSRMLVLHRATGVIEHRHIADIADYLAPGDVMVFNDTKVFPARVFGTWADTPGKVEVLFVEPSLNFSGAWSVMCRSSRPVRKGAVMLLADGKIRAEILGKTDDGRVDIRVESDGDFYDVLDAHGRPPVPPYIRRNEDADTRVETDKTRYQTIYAREVGAVAAPTAGLHFTDELLRTLNARGIGEEFVTLHVGPGTFRPVKTDDVEAHTMDAERYEIPQRTADAIAVAKSAGKRVVAVGSTSVRTLETCANADGTVAPGKGRSTIFIYPPYRFKTVDAMLTNFHLPRSTLIMMVSALAGAEHVLRAYDEAVRNRYRFYSYGDCMLII